MEPQAKGWEWGDTSGVAIAVAVAVAVAEADNRRGRVRALRRVCSPRPPPGFSETLWRPVVAVEKARFGAWSPLPLFSLSHSPHSGVGCASGASGSLIAFQARQLARLPPVDRRQYTLSGRRITHATRLAV